MRRWDEPSLCRLAAGSYDLRKIIADLSKASTLHMCLFLFIVPFLQTEVRQISLDKCSCSVSTALEKMLVMLWWSCAHMTTRGRQRGKCKITKYRLSTCTHLYRAVQCCYNTWYNCFCAETNAYTVHCYYNNNEENILHDISFLVIIHTCRMIKIHFIPIYLSSLPNTLGTWSVLKILLTKTLSQTVISI